MESYIIFIATVFFTIALVYIGILLVNSNNKITTTSTQPNTVYYTTTVSPPPKYHCHSNRSSKMCHSHPYSYSGHTH